MCIRTILQYIGPRVPLHQGRLPPGFRGAPPGARSSWDLTIKHIYIIIKICNPLYVRGRESQFRVRRSGGKLYVLYTCT